MRRLRWLNEHTPDEPFPSADQALADPNGLLAVGGDLSAERLMAAYRNGIFPWYGEGQPILWWSPDPRGIFLPGDFHVSRSLRRRLNQTRMTVTLDTEFEAVMAGCAAPRPDQDGTWITREMIAAYTELHHLGCAHSAEVWLEGELVGGVYGVALNGAFFGESMFSRMEDASKVGLTWLTAQLWRWGFQLFDCQMSNPHLARLGVRQIPRSEYLARLDRALQASHRDSPWRLDNDLDPATEHRSREGS
ncbi:MAG: leucyl/phenylalanyl-tRNA--protein transferase [Halorhodospira halophila]|uniref:leucyl/phenylalanyl-tRNA--protein transferase n=1 Tax=Halorhodospira halophila TaxID=1053 RepID=UPI00191435C3|nr:leucyl/phenylalanyl-tRNA--protein transferase [Halorhodospira halophila]MBK5943716.1 leucyl/phenylalanyl-tRNA--protein transferase [Halorhodospira halophila]MCC3749961.1 leucyl/phenylalanyl-tRNA--protein transferase [Halorhodospira halophila]